MTILHHKNQQLHKFFHDDYDDDGVDDEMKTWKMMKNSHSFILSFPKNKQHTQLSSSSPPERPSIAC
jgi:hypothetical protein